MKIIEIALAEVGTKESPKGTNKQKYGEWFGLNGVAWCGIFVSWCFSRAGFPLGKIGFTKGFAGCQTAVAYFKKNKKIVEFPQEGDIVFFDWNKEIKLVALKAVALVRDCYSGRAMARVMSLAFMVFMAAPVLAPSFGELILIFGSWRLIFVMIAAITDEALVGIPAIAAE
jgi:MFS family permease